MFLKFYGFSAQPFGVTPNPRFLYPSPGHREALASLIYGIENQLGFAALIADPGMGKTTLLFAILQKYRHSARAAILSHTQCSARELLKYLAGEFGMRDCAQDWIAFHEQFAQLLFAEAGKGRTVLAVIDEAQNLDYEALETVRLLSNYETHKAKLLHIILSGQPRLAEKLARPELAQLAQRIPFVSYLEPLSAEETARYIDHRLRVADYHGPALFADDAIAEIASRSHGIPRLINVVCFTALSLGFASGEKSIGRPLIVEAAAELGVRAVAPSRGTAYIDSPFGECAPAWVVRSRFSGGTPDWSCGQPARVAEAAAAAASKTSPQIAATAAALYASSPATFEPAPGRVAIAEQVHREPPSAAIAPDEHRESRGNARQLASALNADGSAPLADQLTSMAVSAAEPELRLRGRPTHRARRPTVGIVASAVALAASLAAIVMMSLVPQAVPVERGTAEATQAQPAKLGPAPRAAAVKTTPAAPPISEKQQPPKKKTSAPGERVKRYPVILQPASHPATASLQPPAGRATNVWRDTSQQPAVNPPVIAPRDAHLAPVPNTTNLSRNDYSRLATIRAVAVGPPPRLNAVEASSQMLPARLLKYPTPPYPANAQAQGIEGSVVITAVIGKDGRLTDFRVGKGDPMLVQAALAALDGWVYAPALLNGKPVEAPVEVRFDFRLRNEKR